jgi:hypothetical protein
VRQDLTMHSVNLEMRDRIEIGLQLERDSLSSEVFFLRSGETKDSLK